MAETGSPIDTAIEFEAWLVQLKARFMARSGMTDAEAQSYVHGNKEAWRDYYVDEFTAEDAADEDMSYWDDDGEDQAVSS